MFSLLILLSESLHPLFYLQGENNLSILAITNAISKLIYVGFIILLVNNPDDSFLVNGKPLLVMDVVEHAYIQQFGNDKEQYLKAFFANINWDEVVKRYQTPKN